jgi:hypothetical protein
MAVKSKPPAMRVVVDSLGIEVHFRLLVLTVSGIYRANRVPNRIPEGELVYKIAVLSPVEAMENRNFCYYSEWLYG